MRAVGCSHVGVSRPCLIGHGAHAQSPRAHSYWRAGASRSTGNLPYVALCRMFYLFLNIRRFFITGPSCHAVMYF